MTVGQKLELVQVGGASFTQHQPLFSHDGKFLFCPSAWSVKVFSTTTGECVHKLLCKGEVKGVVQHPNNKLQVISSTKFGVLEMWDYEDGIQLKSAKVASSISTLYCDPNIKNYAFIVENKVLKRVPLSPMSENSDEIAQNICSAIPQPVGSLKLGKYIVYIKDRESVSVASLENVTECANYKAIREAGEITCLTCHPKEDCIATGHRGGMIKIWHEVCPILGKTKAPVTSILSWHSDFVRSMSFTPGGSSLLSVSFQPVLVQWHYKEGAKKNFLPRLGYPCNHVVVNHDGTLYATTHDDNSISIITNNFSVSVSVKGLTSKRLGKFGPKIFQYDSKTKSCVTMGKLGHLTFFDLVEDREVYSLDITHENFISTRGTYETEVICVANQENCKNEKAWMATMETAILGELLVENRLKLWVLDEADKWWKLSTIIKEPHSKVVTRLCFRPTSSHSTQSQLVSTGMDGMVKLWEFQTSTSNWSCVATASYREMPALYCDFSQDGSVLAVAFNDVVCLFDPSNLEISLVIRTHEKKEKVKKLVFGRHACQHMLIMQSKSCIQGYDLLNGVLSWVADMSISHIAADPFSEFMYMISEDFVIYVIRPSSSELLYTYQIRKTMRTILSMVCIPHSNSCHVSNDNCSSVPWMAHSKLYIADNNLSIFSLSPHGHFEEHKPMKAKKSKPSNLQTPMAHLLDKNSNVNNDPIESSHVPQGVGGRNISSALKMITDSPAHVLPSVSNYCGDFLTSFLEALQINDHIIAEGGLHPTGFDTVDSSNSKTGSSSKMIELTKCLQPRAAQMKFLGDL